MRRVSVIGRLGRDATVTTDQNGRTRLEVTIATRVKNDDDTVWFDVVSWSPSLIKNAQYLTKGKQIHCTGVLQVRAYLNKNGEPDARLTIWLDAIDYIDSGKNQQEGNGGYNQQGGNDYQMPYGQMPQSNPMNGYVSQYPQAQQPYGGNNMQQPPMQNLPYGSSQPQPQQRPVQNPNPTYGGQAPINPSMMTTGGMQNPHSGATAQPIQKQTHQPPVQPKQQVPTQQPTPNYSAAQSSYGNSAPSTQPYEDDLPF